MAADLSKLSTEDLVALKAGDLTKVSDAGLQTLKASQRQEAFDADPHVQGARNFAKDMPFGEKLLAGTGSAFQDVIDAGKQMVGFGPNKEEVRERRKIDAPLMRTGGGFMGKLAGNVSIFAPLAVVPGANTVAGAAALGATAAALQPTEDAKERLVNMGEGAVLGGGTQAAATKGAQMLGERAARIEAESAAARQKNAVRDATLKAGQEAGYVVPPSAANPSFLNKRLESVAGKAATGQQANVGNQAVTNRLAAEELGLPANTPITEQVLEKARDAAAQPYRDVSKLMGVDLMDQLKQARFDAKAQWTYYQRSANPEALKAAQAATKTVDQLEGAMESFARAAGKPEMVDQLRAARTYIAKTYDVEHALNTATGDVSARLLDSRPVSGKLKTATDFYNAFPTFMRDGARVPSPGVSKSEAIAAALLGTVGGPAAAALPFASHPTRAAILSPAYQARMAVPQYPKALDVDPEKLAMVARAMALPGAAAMAGAER